MNVIGKGMAAGLVATVILSVLMILQSAAGLLPQVDVIAILAETANEIAGLPDSPVVGWMIHGVIGIVIGGGLFTMAYTYFRGQIRWYAASFIP